MATTTMKNLLHPMQHHRDKKEGVQSQSQHHSGPLHDRNDSAMERPREEEKRTLAQWEDNKHTLSPDEIDKDPNKKVVGHSSKVLREEDFELIKTLGTGARAPLTLARRATSC
jgi:protein kinase A